MVELLNTLNGMSPLAVIALLGLVIYLLVKQRAQTATISDNHLSGLPEMARTLERIEASINDMARDVTWLRAKSNGCGK
jgi:hypothetical protein